MAELYAMELLKVRKETRVSDTGDGELAKVRCMKSVLSLLG